MSRIARAWPVLDVRDLEVVLALAESGSTVKAAALLHVTQSAVSRGLLLVEDKLDTRLFERTPRGLVPTQAGLRLIERAGGVLAQLVELEQAVRAPVDEPVHLRIVCECYTAYRWLPTTLASLQASLGKLDITLALEHTREPVRALLADEVDIAFVTTSRVHGGLGELPLFSDEIVFLVAANHPLAAAPAITPDDLRTYPMITSTTTPDPERRWFFTRVFGRARPRVQAVRFPLTEAIIDATRAGMGIAAMSEWIARPYLGSSDLVTKRLRGKPLRRPWRVAFRREYAAHAKQLAAALASAPPRLYA